MREQARLDALDAPEPGAGLREHAALAGVFGAEAVYGARALRRTREGVAILLIALTFSLLAYLAAFELILTTVPG
ncbi:hypothetical protein ABZ770_32155 [Streptomyces sp. NPDC006654]|uniref:hypothetical protein n=1 Tax=Streptomyces sp. NPDC006654 TaxID=3156897 RepID=UPI0033EB2A05